MSGRIDSVRKELKAALDKLNPDKDWSFITKQVSWGSSRRIWGRIRNCGYGRVVVLCVPVFCVADAGMVVG